MSDPFAEIQWKIRTFMRASLEGAACAHSFEELVLELFHIQRENNLAYEKLCRVRGIREVKDWREIPAVPAVAFKELEMTSLVENERRRVFYSSGTTQRDRSRHFHSEGSLALYEESLWLWFEVNFRERMRGMKWLFLTPPGSRATNSSLAHMFEIIASKQAAEDVDFVGSIDGEGGWTVDLKGALERLNEFERRGQPVAILGTAFQFVHLLDELEQRGRKFALPEGSWILETGGYKGRSRELTKEELRGALGESLGIPRERLLGEYGMSELSSQAYDSSDGKFQFPPWARSRIISPASGLAAAVGERGLIRVYDLANIWSVTAVQTEDFGMSSGEGFHLAGRAAQAEARGCSLMSV